MRHCNVTKKILSAVLILALLVSVICISAVSAADMTAIEFGQVTATPGSRVEVPVVIRQNPGIATFRFWIGYDMQALTLVSVEKGEALKKGTLKYSVDETDTAVTWFNVSNITGDGELFKLVFDVSADAAGDYPLTVSYRAEDIANASLQLVECTVQDGLIRVDNHIDWQKIDLNNDGKDSPIDAQILAEANADLRTLTPEQWAGVAALTPKDIIDYILNQ